MRECCHIIFCLKAYYHLMMMHSPDIWENWIYITVYFYKLLFLISKK